MKISCFCIALLLITFGKSAQGQVVENRPNVIIIYVDDMGYGDLGSYGAEISTPNIDKIGKTGIRFTNFYASAPVCTPSRYSLLTGTYPQRSKHNLTFALMPDDKNYLDTSETTMATRFKSEGYLTGMIGKWHLGQANSINLLVDYGFDLFTGALGGCIDYFSHTYGQSEGDWYVNGKLQAEKGYSTDLITNHAVDFIHLASKKKQPFYLYLPYNAPHYGKTDPENIKDYTLSLGETKYKGRNDLNTLQVPQTYLNKVSNIADPYRRAYAAMVMCLDHNVGKLMDRLKKEGILENTMIWFISDNGGYSKSYYGHASNGKLRGQKAELWEGGIRVPALLSWPAKVKPGQVVSTPLVNMDIMPTLAGIIGCANNKVHTDGADIRKVLFNQGDLKRNLYWKYGKQTAVRSGDWKLVNGTELYNLKFDEGETTNVARKYPELVKSLNIEFSTNMP
ncbi:sulfatase-like hydrolase/transferase [Pedobacter nyackensis]|uniref:Arylsulfatase A n=1 Tax=Pedobacter nyackensis TaxID=475255 RepID=A0A1W2AFE9_9SPHI|nr:sulfatase-like hydrolase/transferase [Pedobacter nyackensis]SMC59310.1 Arylsulfatase A [Pedobacter nyackensis]